MKRMNYSTDYIEQWIRTGVSNESMVEFARQAIKFQLPDGGLLLEVGKYNKNRVKPIAETFSQYLPYVKLPYERTLLEFDFEGRPSIIFAAQMQDGVFFKFASKIDVYGHALWCDYDVDCYIDDGCNLTFKLTESTTSDREPNDNDNHYIPNMAHILLTFLSALQCNNTRPEIIKAPKFINTKRKKKGLTPIFEYKVLTIDTQSTGSSQGAGKGTHASPRVHLRRGHIRRLIDKIVWVNPCVVGDKSKGVIHKDYEVV